MQDISIGLPEVAEDGSSNLRGNSGKDEKSSESGYIFTKRRVKSYISENVRPLTPDHSGSNSKTET